MTASVKQFAGDLRRAVGALGDALGADLDGLPPQVAADVVFVRQELLGLIERCEGKDTGCPVAGHEVCAWDSSDVL